MSVLRWLRNFVDLQPVFTLRAVQVFWWLYVCERLYNTHWRFARTVTPWRPQALWLFDWVDWLFITPLRVLVALATARLLIEVLLAVLIPSGQQQQPGAQSLWRELLAFFDLQPFFTRWWLQVFWWLFLLTFLRSIYLHVMFNPLRWMNVAGPHEWIRYLIGFIGPLTWLAGVRLLIEVTPIVQTPAARAPQRTNP